MTAAAVVTRYPIYTVRADWTQDGDGEPRKWWPTELPAGRIWNMTSFDRMYRDDPGAEEIERWARDDWWPKYLVAEPRIGDYKNVAELNPRDLVIAVKRGIDEEWCGGWFGHWTFDNGQTDAEVLASFEAFVQRMEKLNRAEGEVINGLWTEPYCLMGAEDRWRWSAKGDRNEPAPCRCADCKAQGVIRISH